MQFNLLLKSSGEVIDKTHATDLNEAKEFFIQRKQMKPEMFFKLFDVCQNINTKK